MLYRSLMSFVTLGLISALSLLALQLPDQTSEGKGAYLDSLDVDITILPNSDIRVIEKQRYIFQGGTFYYGYRWIPLDEVDSIDGFSVYEDGRPYTQKPPGPFPTDSDIESIEATGIEPNIFSAWTEGNGQWIKWWYPETTGGSRNFEIRYVVHGSIKTNQNNAQLNWQAVFSDHSTAINQTKVTVRLPDGVSPAELSIYSSGVEAQSRIINDRTIEFTSGVVAPNEALNVIVTFPHRIIEATYPPLSNEPS